MIYYIFYGYLNATRKRMNYNNIIETITININIFSKNEENKNKKSKITDVLTRLNVIMRFFFI
jgi:hypothetical protein